jgi:uncharacterized membrane protein (UPF0136 family)
MEPWGRIGSGIVELIASVLLLIRRTAWLGALLALGTICGAIFFHLTILGIEVQGDGGFLFILACVVFIASAIILIKERKNIPVIGKNFGKAMSYRYQLSEKNSLLIVQATSFQLPE